MRPKVKKIIGNITSPKSAFLIGFIVTLFLLPCTIGPYIVASGLLSELGTIGAIPWLLYYNLVFILPMIVITLIVYLGLARVEDVSGWKEKNIRKLHLTAGILLFLVGLGIILGWI
jgi:cytochrome c biogenesis protein CcdA